MVMAGRVHAVVDGEIAANEIGAHRCVLLGQSLRFVDGVSLIFAVIDANDTSVA